jgi:hypothetical protein
MENENNKNQQGNLGSAGSEGTQAYNNGNEGRDGNDRGTEESGAFEASHTENYEGGNLGTAGSGGMDIPVTPSSNETNQEGFTSSHGNDTESDIPKVPVPIVKDDYEGGNLGSAGSGTMDINGSESSNSTDALSSDSKANTASGNNAGSDTPTATPANHGAGPASFIPDGSDGQGAKQPKEHTGKDTEMGGATGGTPGMGYGNDKTGLEGEGTGNAGGSESGSGGGGSSAGSGAGS